MFLESVGQYFEVAICLIRSQYSSRYGDQGAGWRDGLPNSGQRRHAKDPHLLRGRVTTGDDHNDDIAMPLPLWVRLLELIELLDRLGYSLRKDGCAID